MPRRDASHTLEMLLEEIKHVRGEVKCIRGGISDVSKDVSEIRVQIGKLEDVPSKVDGLYSRLTAQEIKVSKIDVKTKALWAVGCFLVTSLGGLFVWLIKSAA